MTRFAVPLLFAIAATVTPAQDLKRKAPPEVDDALKTRVSSFYQHFQRGEFRQAEGFLDNESKDLFYNSRKNRVLDFNIQNVDYGDDFRSAKVLVVCKTIIPMLGSDPVDMPLNSDWRFNEGDWWMHLSEHKRAAGEQIPSPAGPMSFNHDVAAPGSAFRGQQGAQAARPTIESLASMYRISTDTLTFPKAATEPVSRSMSVKSASVGRLSLEKTSGPIAGIEVEIEGEAIEPGGEATIKFTYDPAKAEHVAGRVRVDFVVMPISQSFQVYLDF